MPCKTRNMDSEERMAAAHELEMKHEKHIHQAQLIAKEEDARRQKVTKQVLLAENSTLREQLAEKDAQINQLTDKCDETRSELDSLKATSHDQQTQIKSQTREFANIKAELESLNSLSQESTKVLSEKLALSRELNALRPELEHLRSQVAHQQTAIAEKLALERELNMVEVQLANEKRVREQQAAQAEGNKTTEDELSRKLKDTEKKLAAEKREKEQLQKELDSVAAAAQSGEDNKKADQELKKKLQEAEKMLLSERREKERLRKENEVALSEAQAQNEMLEQRLDTLRSKLRITQEELKSMRSEVVHTSTVPTKKADTAARVGGAKAQNARKRRVEELSISDMSIGTPEDVTRGRRQLKKKEQALVGEKSTFSITPFLAKSKTLTVEDAVAEEEENEADVSYVPLAHQAQQAAAEAEAEAQASAGEDDGPEPETADSAEAEPEKPALAPKETKTKTKAKSNGEPKKARGRPKKALAEASPNMPVQAPSASNDVAKSGSLLDKVLEEPEAGEQENAVPPAKTTAAEKKATVTSTGVREQEVKRKKRKLAGDSTTLFDDDGEAETANVKRPGGKVAPGAGKALGKTHLSLVRNAGAFGKRSFSPLKKDRRGVGASFLA
ncbi:hypothetical protein CGCSCA5_v012649 [Colletotrichum siamense]|nr:hypothetical protein CGCSCA5_v012649 [Colletotrichum siamense]KAI8153079.1 hypothetical protein K4K50_008815 [Colletotrichum sp. SAR 10_71]KAI8158552.1 hypothetical protein K4K49_007932 [Colletotrichum sp. SAR 10_70]KAI8159857.1 hypothetical protein KHU50_008749 [Colletotrichum sp. SAR 10_65]KAI8174336.1 hypothetical protein K4K51_008853 [Colletotrichum sp. SAR 10_75]KAI8217667.1 hypothetical protein K4K53_009056 [Colletotrichum sp. SAR 10_77]KAI8220119.1 hypothetical protein K4K54_008880 